MVFCVYLFGCMLQTAYKAISKRFRRISQFQIRNTQSNHIKSGIHHTDTKSQFQIRIRGAGSGLYLPGPSRCPAQAVCNRSDNRRGVSRVLCIRAISNPDPPSHPAQAVILQSCHPEQVCRPRCCPASAASHPGRHRARKSRLSAKESFWRYVVCEENTIVKMWPAKKGILFDGCIVPSRVLFASDK